MGEEDPTVSREEEGSEANVYDIWNSLNGFAAWAKVKKEVGDDYNADYHLFRSCEIGNVGMCRFLLDCKLVSANTPWRYSGGYILGSLPIDVANQYNQKAVVELLEERGKEEVEAEGEREEDEGETPGGGRRGKRRRGRGRGEGDLEGLTNSQSIPDLKSRLLSRGESGAVRKRGNRSGSVIETSELRRREENDQTESGEEITNGKSIHFIKFDESGLPSHSSTPAASPSSPSSSSSAIGSSSFSARRDAVSLTLNTSFSSSFSHPSSPSPPPLQRGFPRHEETPSSPAPSSPSLVQRASSPSRPYFKPRRNSSPPRSKIKKEKSKPGQHTPKFKIKSSPPSSPSTTPLSPSLSSPLSPASTTSDSPTPSLPSLSLNNDPSKMRGMYTKSASSSNFLSDSPSAFSQSSGHIPAFPSHLRPNPPGGASPSPSLASASQFSSTRIYSPKYADRFLLIMAGKFYRSIFKFFESQIEHTQDSAQQNMLELAFQRIEEELINSFPPSVVRLLPISHGALYGVGSTRLARVAGRGRLASIFLKVSDLTSRKSMTVEEFDVEINHHSAFDMMVNVLTPPPQEEPQPQPSPSPSPLSRNPSAPPTPPSRPPRTTSPLASPSRPLPALPPRAKQEQEEKIVAKKELLPPPPPPRGKTEEKRLRTNVFSTFGEMLSLHSESDILFFLKSINLAMFGNLRDPLTLSTPLHRLCEHGNLAFIRGMLEHGCPVDVRDEKGLLPLHFLVKKLGKGDMSMEKDLTDVEFVVKKLVGRADPMYVPKGGDGDTLLHLFVKQGSLFLVKLLLNSSFCVPSGPPSPTSSPPKSSLERLETRNNEGLTVWDCAVQLESEEVGIEIVQELMEKVSVSTLASDGPSILKSVSKTKKIYSYVIDRMVSVLPCVYGLSEDPLQDPKDPDLLQSIAKDDLVAILMSPKTRPEFLKKMLSCRQYWIPPSELFASCVRYAHSPHCESVNSVYRLLCLWSEVCPRDFSSIEMKMLMPGLMERGGRGGGHFRKRWEERWVELQNGQGEVLKELEAKCLAVEEKFGKIKVPDLMDISVTMVAVDVFAEHWFFWCYNLQKMIPMGELLTYPLSSAVSASSSARPPSTSDATLSPLTFFNTLLNDITNWVVILILSLRVVEERVKMITYFVELLDRSWQNRNFCLSLALSTALQNHAISRLKNTWRRVDEEIVEKLERLRGYFSPSRNFQLFREALVSTNGPATVYFGVAFRDLIYLHDSAPTFVGPNQASINVQKLSGIFKVGEKWHQNLIKFDSPSMATPANYSIFSLVPGCYELFNSDALDKISRILEPPQKQPTDNTKKHKTKPRGGSKTSRISLSVPQQAWISSLTNSFPSLGGKCFVDEDSPDTPKETSNPTFTEIEGGESCSFSEIRGGDTEKFEVTWGEEKGEEGEKGPKRKTVDLGKLKRNVSSRLPKKLAKREDD